MAQHDALGVACGSTRIDEESKIVVRVSLGPAISDRATDVSDAGKMLELSGRISYVSGKDDAVFRYADSLGGGSCDLDDGPLGDESLCARVFELKGKLVNSVAGICRRHYGTGPMCSPHDDGCVDAIWGEKC